MNLNFIGEIANAIPQVTGQFNNNYLNSQVQIAEANARAAEASARNQPNRGTFSDTRTILFVVAGIALIAGLYIAFKPSKK